MGTSAVPWKLLLQALPNDDNYMVRKSAAEALAELVKRGEPPEEVMQTLAQATHDERCEVRLAAKKALDEIKAAAEQNMFET